MTTPGKAVVKFVRRVDSLGNGVASKILTDFTVTAFQCTYTGSPATYASSPALTDLANGYYAFTFNLPPSAGFGGADIVPASGTDSVFPVMFSGEVEAYDLKAIAALVAKPAATVSSASLIFNQIPIQLEAYAFRILALKVVDQSGAAVDLTVYNNFVLGIRDVTGVAFKWEAASGSIFNFSVTGDASGNLTIQIPESSFGPVYQTWAASVTRAVGDFVVPTVANGYIYQATVGGAGSGVQPTWPTTPGNTVADGAVTWTCLAKQIWMPSAAVAAGAIYTPQSAGNTLAKFFLCVTGGTTSGSEPTWAGGPGTTVTDGTVTWKIFNDFNAAVVAGVQSVGMYLELRADLLNTAKTVPIIPPSPLTLSQRVVGL